MVVTFFLLALAILSLWLGGVWPQAARWPSFILFTLSLIAALVAGIVQPLGLVWISLLALAVYAFSRPNASPRLRLVSGVALIAISAGLMAHRLLGFNNPRVLSSIVFSPGAIPYSLYLNYDKPLIGLFILAWCHPLLTRAPEWRNLLARILPVIVVLLPVVLIPSLALKYVRFDPKFPEEAWLWLGVNLLFTCVAEEAFFRGFIQAQLRQLWRTAPRGEWLALLAAAVLFGLAHFAGGPSYVFLATVAGVGYGWAYHRTQRIEASILTHFTLNAVHFFGFTYPALAR